MNWGGEVEGLFAPEVRARVTRTPGWMHDGDRIEIWVGDGFCLGCTLEARWEVSVRVIGEAEEVRRAWDVLQRWSCSWETPQTVLESIGEETREWDLRGRGRFRTEMDRRIGAVGALRVAAEAVLLEAGEGGELVVEE